MSFKFLNRKVAALFLSMTVLGTLFTGVLAANPEQNPLDLEEREIVSDNLVVNGDFEDGLNGWDNPKSKAVIENTDSVDDSDYAYITKCDWGEGLNQKINDMVAGDYTLEFDFKGQAKIWFGEEQYGPAPDKVNNIPKTSLNEWEHVKLDFTVPSDVSYYTLSLMGTDYDTLFDNVAIYRYASDGTTPEQPTATVETVPTEEAVPTQETTPVVPAEPEEFNYTLEEDFDYDNGPLDTLNGGTGWYHGWYVQGANNAWAVADSNPLKYSNLLNSPSYFKSGGSYLASGRFIWDKNAEVPSELAGYCNDDKLIGKPGQTIWISALYRQNKDGQGYITTNDGADFPESLYPNNQDKKDQNNVIAFGASKDAKWGFMSHNEFASTGKAVKLEETVFLVMKYEYTLDGKTNITMYVNPKIGTEQPETAYTATMTVDQLQGFKAFAFAPGNDEEHGNMDALRMGGSYIDVSPVDPSIPEEQPTTEATSAPEETEIPEPTPKPANLFVNGDFEDELNGWTTGGQSPVLSTEGSPDGTQYLNLTGNKQWADGITQTVNLIPGEHVFEMDGKGVFMLFIAPAADEYNALDGVENEILNAEEWTHHEVHFTVPEGQGGQYKVRVFVSNGSDHEGLVCSLDNLYLYRIPVEGETQVPSASPEVTATPTGEETPTATPTDAETSTATPSEDPTASPTATASPATTTVNKTAYIPVSKVQIAKVSGTVKTTAKVTIYNKTTGKKVKIATVKKNKTIKVKSIKGTYAKVTYGKKTGYVKVTSLKFSKSQKGKVLAATKAYKKASTKNGYYSTFAKNKSFTVKGRSGQYYTTTVKVVVKK